MQIGQTAGGSVTTAPLVLTGLDANVARAHGYKVGTRPDGAQYSAGPTGTLAMTIDTEAIY